MLTPIEAHLPDQPGAGVVTQRVPLALGVDQGSEVALVVVFVLDAPAIGLNARLDLRQPTVDVAGLASVGVGVAGQAPGGVASRTKLTVVA